MNKERISYIDITKGILIVCVIVLHSLCFHIQYAFDRVNDVYESLVYPLGRMFVPYFMAAFFVLATLKGVKIMKFREVAIYGAKRLLLPMVLLFPWYSIWFCWAMFFDLLLYHLLGKLENEVVKIGVLLVLAFVGIACSHYGYDYHSLDYAFVLLPFFYLGEHYKVLFTDNRVGIFLLVVYALLSFGYAYYDKIPPFVAGEHLWVGRNAPIYYLMAISGSSAIIMIGRWINRNRILEYIGRNSMIYFLTHFYVMAGVIQLNGFISSIGGNIPLSVCFILFTIALAIGFSTICSILINKYCPWIMGRNLK